VTPSTTCRFAIYFFFPRILLRRFSSDVEVLCLLAIIQPFLRVIIILLICQVPKLLPSERNMAAAPVNLGDVVNLGGTVAVDVSVFFL